MLFNSNYAHFRNGKSIHEVQENKTSFKANFYLEEVTFKTKKNQNKEFNKLKENPSVGNNPIWGISVRNEGSFGSKAGHIV